MMLKFSYRHYQPLFLPYNSSQMLLYKMNYVQNTPENEIQSDHMKYELSNKTISSIIPHSYG